LIETNALPLPISLCVIVSSSDNQNRVRATRWHYGQFQWQRQEHGGKGKGHEGSCPCQPIQRWSATGVCGWAYRNSTCKLRCVQKVLTSQNG